MRRKRLTGGNSVAAGLLAAAIVAATVAGFVLTRDASRESDLRLLRSQALEVEARLQARVDTTLATMRTVAARLGRGGVDLGAAAGSVLAVPGVLDAAVLVRDGAGNHRVVAAAPGGSPLRAATSLRSEGALSEVAASVAVDGAPRATPLVTSPYAGVFVALHVDAVPAPETLVFRLDPQALVAGAVPAERAEAVRAVVTDGDTVIARAGAARASTSAVATSAVAIADREWDLRVRPARAPGTASLLPWAILLLGLAAAPVVLLAGRRGQRAWRRAGDEADARTRGLSLVADTSALLQESLDLADLLPAFCVHLMDDCDLDRISVLLADGEGSMKEVFSLGPNTVDGAARALPPSVDAAAPGTEFSIGLQRAGRSFGAIRTRSRAPIDAPTMQALRAVADLLAAAAGNAQLYAREQEAVRGLREVDRMKSDFVSTVSHEMRTAMTAIAGFGDLLARNWEHLPDDRRRDFVDRITRNAASLQVLVDDMLEFDRLDRMQIEVAPDPVALDVLVGELIDQMSTLLANHRCEHMLVPGTIALADAAAVERILGNLLSNAAKYAPEGSTVTVRVGADRGRAFVLVDDEGPGVPPEDRDRIFTRFVRGGGEATKAIRGTGVGLAIVKELVVRMGGTVEVEDAPGGRGARFAVHLPLAPAPAPAPASAIVPPAPTRPDHAKDRV